MTVSYFTLAPADHPTDPTSLENGHRIWSTFQRRNRNTIYVRTNNPKTAGGQEWQKFATKVHVWETNKTGEKRTRKTVWLIPAGKGYLQQAGALLARYFDQQGSAFRSESKPYQGRVKRYKATAKVYSLPSILNGYQAVVSRDRAADERRKKAKRDLSVLIQEAMDRKRLNGGGGVRRK